MTYSMTLPLGWTKHPCSKKHGRSYVFIPLIGGGASSCVYSPREYGRFLSLLKVCSFERCKLLTHHVCSFLQLGRRRNIKHLWAYMLLGQIVAISVATNLFYLALVLSESSVSGRLKRTVSLKLVISVLLSLGTIALSPFTSQKTFLPNLLVMHLLLFIPLISNTPSSPEVSSSAPKFSISLKTLYRIIHLACAGIHVRTIFVAISSLQASSSLPSSQSSFLDVFNEAWTILYSHPAQSSIGWDVIWTSISFIVWILLRPSSSTSETKKHETLIYLMLSTPVASIAVTAPYALRPRGDVTEGVRGVRTDSKKKR